MTSEVNSRFFKPYWRRGCPITMKVAVYLLVVFAVSACKVFVPFTRTDEGGIRIINRDKLKFNGEQFHLTDITQIDTNAIYVFSNYELAGAQPFEISNASYCRFFPDGQVLFAACDTIPSAQMVNNKQIGWEGYYKIENNRLIIREFKIINGGQINLRWGYFKDGDIVFFSGRPSTYSHSWEKMEKKDLKERWKKVKIAGMTRVVLEW
jgi:hypothetical protein